MWHNQARFSVETGRELDKCHSTQFSALCERFSRDLVQTTLLIRSTGQTGREVTHRLSPVSWSMSVTGIFRSRSSCGESLDCWRDNSRECAASRWRASFERGIVAFDLINDEVVVVCTSGTSKEFVDDGLADPVDNSSFWASFSVMFTPSSPSSARKKKKSSNEFVAIGREGRLMTGRGQRSVRCKIFVHFSQIEDV